jgi:hypothetical protein
VIPALSPRFPSLARTAPTDSRPYFARQVRGLCATLLARGRLYNGGMQREKPADGLVIEGDDL